MAFLEQIRVAGTTLRPSPYLVQPGSLPRRPRPRAKDRQGQTKPKKKEKESKANPCQSNTTYAHIEKYFWEWNAAKEAKEGKAAVVNDSDSNEVEILDSPPKPPKKTPQGVFDLCDSDLV